MTQADQNEIQHIRDMADRVRRNGREGVILGDWVVAIVKKWTSDADTASDCWAIREAYTKEFGK